MWKIPKISYMKTIPVELNPLHGKFSWREFSKFSKRESQKFDHDFYSKLPFLAQSLLSSTEKIFVYGIFGTFYMVPTNSGMGLAPGV